MRIGIWLIVGAAILLALGIWCSAKSLSYDPWGLGFLILAVAFTSIGILLLIPAWESIRRGM